MIRSVPASVLLVALAGWANAAGTTAVPIRNGLNQVTLGKDHVLALRAQRENFNVHGFDLVSFYLPGEREKKGRLYLIPLFGKDGQNDKEAFNVTVGGGADCLLHDFRLLQPDGKQPARLVVAERDFGASYADAEKVHFTYYRLARNDGEEGHPPLYFQLQRKSVSRQKYCDVNEAFDRELGMGPSSGGDHP
jgi:hypothetical protein